VSVMSILSLIYIRFSKSAITCLCYSIFIIYLSHKISACVTAPLAAVIAAVIAASIALLYAVFSLVELPPGFNAFINSSAVLLISFSSDAAFFNLVAAAVNAFEVAAFVAVAASAKAASAGSLNANGAFFISAWLSSRIL
jgi:hypothetical protein